MKRLALVLAPLAMACTTVPSGSAGPASEGSCDASGLGELVGQNPTAELGAEAMRRSGSTRLRWIRPGDAVTMDFSEHRLNIHLDASGRVERFACG